MTKYILHRDNMNPDGAFRGYLRVHAGSMQKDASGTGVKNNDATKNDPTLPELVGAQPNTSLLFNNDGVLVAILGTGADWAALLFFFRFVTCQF